VHLVASVHSDHTSAVNVLARYGSASRGEPLYEALVQLGRLDIPFGTADQSGLRTAGLPEGLVWRQAA
jgi:Tn3 transposase DDE domain